MHYELLNNILTPDDLIGFSSDDLTLLATEIRKRIISVLSLNGGHLASNLGIVELTVALHKVFDSPKDKIIFDTSHQTYTHKILTGRNKDLESLRRHKGIAGFAHPQESIHDHFFSGHAGTALSSALGLAQSRSNPDYVLTVLGDASLTCGLTFEALNNIPKDLKRFIIVLNDNEMAITKNVGHIHDILFPSSAEKFFNNFGLEYIGPIDGHNIDALTTSLEKAQMLNKPVLMHVRTIKGKGLHLARENPTDYHGAKPFDKISGQFNCDSQMNRPSFSSIFGSTLLEMAQKDPDIYAISPAMLAGSGLIPFKEKYPSRCIDVGIAENHALTFAGGLAYKGKKKVFAAIYSTFLQRAFDNVFHDICLQDVPVVLGIDRAGLNGPDGVTHHGIYDVGFLLSMPNITVSCPRNGQVLKELISSSIDWKKPSAIRFPNARTEEPSLVINERIPGQAEVLKRGKDLLIIAVGTFCQQALEVANLLEADGISTTVVDPVFLKPIDENFFSSIIEAHDNILTLEEHALSYGFGSYINNFMIQKQLHHKKEVLNLGIPDQFVHHGHRDQLLHDLKLDTNTIYRQVNERFFMTKSKKTSQRSSYDYCSLSQ